jgi:hypothetical protein
MGKTVSWVTDMGAAISEAQGNKRLILLDFFNPG